MVLEDMIVQEPVVLSGVVEFGETFVLDGYKGTPVSENTGRETRKQSVPAFSVMVALLRRR